MKKTSISSVVCFDIIDFNKKSEAEQQVVKKQFNALVDLAVVDIPEKDRLIVDTGHGAIVTCSGPLENALEDALFIALTVRDEVLNSNAESENPLYLLIGINLGSVKVANNTNGNDEPNIIGEGLVEAQLIMSFANPNQILVSRAYYDMASKLTLEVAQMFEKYDMHAYEHDIYAVRLLNGKVATENSPLTTENIETQEEAVTTRPFSWGIYILPIFLAMAMLFAFTKWMMNENATEAIEQPAIESTTTIENNTISSDADAVDDETIMLDVAPQEATVQEQAETLNKEVVKKKTSQEKATTKNSKPKKPEPKKSIPSNKSSNAEKPVVSPEPVESADETNQSGEKSGWETFKESIKQGSGSDCTQAEKAMNQCN